MKQMVLAVSTSKPLMMVVIIIPFWPLGRAENPRTVFRQLANPSRSRQLKFSEFANEDREAVEVPLPNSMHAGQIIMLTKMLTSSDLRFYGFEDGVPVERWHAGLSGSSQAPGRGQ